MPPKYPPVRALCLHGHFYQPPREHPWLGVVGPEASAAPDRDWNTRITRECYAPNAQARRIRPLGADDAAWTPVTPESLDVSRLYRCLLPGGGFVDVVFRHAALSHGVAFGALLGDGVELAKRLRAALDDDGSIVAIAV